MKIKTASRIKIVSNWLDQLIPYFSLIGIIIALGVALSVYTISKNTQSILTKQDRTLDAIKELSLDNKLTSKQLGDTIICMLQVPIAQRTPDIKENCIKQATQTTQIESQAQQARTIADNPQTSVESNSNSQNSENTTQPKSQKTFVGNILDNIQKGLENIVDRGLLQ